VLAILKNFKTINSQQLY